MSFLPPAPSFSELDKQSSRNKAKDLEVQMEKLRMVEHSKRCENTFMFMYTLI
jgi:hypothetical protein